MFPSPRLMICAVAEIADKRLGLSIYAFHSGASTRRPGDHARLPSHLGSIAA
jgi:hypothetical protein